MDLRSDYEKSEEIENFLKLIIEPTFSLFYCDKIATKAIATATERISTFNKIGFKKSNEKLVGHDGTQYDSYFVLNK